MSLWSFAVVLVRWAVVSNNRQPTALGFEHPCEVECVALHCCLAESPENRHSRPPQRRCRTIVPVQCVVLVPRG